MSFYGNHYLLENFLLSFISFIHWTLIFIVFPVILNKNCLKLETFDRVCLKLFKKFKIYKSIIFR